MKRSMKRRWNMVLLFVAMFGLGFVAHAGYQTFTSTVVITVNLANPTAATQVIADNQRDARLLDFCKAYNLDVYVTPNVPASGVNPAKIVPAFRGQVQKYVIEVIKSYRASKDGATASAATAATEATVVP